MQLSSKHIEDGCHNSHFDNGVWVGITPAEGTWEYQQEDDEDTYMSGMYQVDGNTVFDYDGCFVLPVEVIMALAQEYDIDL